MLSNSAVRIISDSGSESRHLPILDFHCQLKLSSRYFIDSSVVMMEVSVPGLPFCHLPSKLNRIGVSALHPPGILQRKSRGGCLHSAVRTVSRVDIGSQVFGNLWAFFNPPGAVTVAVVVAVSLILPEKVPPTGETEEHLLVAHHRYCSR